MRSFTFGALRDYMLSIKRYCTMYEEASLAGFKGPSIIITAAK